MPWVKIDAGIAEHPKIAAVGPLGLALHVAAITYCERNLTDGFVPRGVAARLISADGLEELIEQMVAVRLWEVVEGGYLVHDYLAFNQSKAEVLALREVRAEAGRRGGKQNGSKSQAKAKQVASGLLPVGLKQNASKTEADRDIDIDRDIDRDRSTLRVPVEQSSTPVSGPMAEAESSIGDRPDLDAAHAGTSAPRARVCARGRVEAPAREEPLRLVGEEEPNPERQVFDAWLSTLDGAQRQMTPARQKHIRARLREYPLEDVIDAVRGWQCDPWDGRREQNDLVILLRNGEQLEKFRDLWRHPPAAPMPRGAREALDDHAYFDGLRRHFAARAAT